jgi:hypothetical protein
MSTTFVDMVSAKRTVIGRRVRPAQSRPRPYRLGGAGLTGREPTSVRPKGVRLSVGRVNGAGLTQRRVVDYRRTASSGCRATV